MAIFPVFSKKPLMMPSTFMPIFLGPKMGFSKCPLMMPSTFMPIFLGAKKGHFPPMGIGRNFQFLGFSLMMPSTFMPIFWPHFCRKLCFRWILSIFRNWIFWIGIFLKIFEEVNAFFAKIRFLLLFSIFKNFCSENFDFLFVPFVVSKFEIQSFLFGQKLKIYGISK